MAGTYNRPMLDDEEEQDQYQDVAGFRVPVNVLRESLSATPVEATTSAAVKPLSSMGTVRPSTRVSIPDVSRPDLDLDVNGLTPEIRSLIGNGTPRIEQVPKPPDSGMSDLVRQRAQAAVPIDRNAVDDSGKKIYRMGLGQRLVGALGNFASGMNRQGPVVYTGPGATNRRYDEAVDTQNRKVNALDTQIKQTKDVSDEMRKIYDEGLTAAYRGNLLDIRQENNRERNKLQSEKNDIAAELAAQKNDSRAIQYDPKTKQFTRGGQVYIPKNIEEGATLESAYGIDGEFSRKWRQQDKNNQSTNPFAQVYADLAKQRVDDAKQAKIDQVQRDIDDKVQKHKASILKRIDEVELDKPTSASSQEEWNAYKAKLAQIERDDYAGMNQIGKSLSSRLSGFGIRVPAPTPQAWQTSNLDDKERANLLGGSAPAAAPSPAPTRSNAQADADLPPQKEATIRYQVNGKTYNIPASKKAAFLRDMPNAKQVNR